MDLQNVLPLFCLFAGVEDAAGQLPLIDGAIREVRNRLRPEADASDSRLSYLCAALAHLRYVQLLAAQSRVTYTRAGSAQQDDPAAYTGFARALLDEYTTAARDLLQDESFVFSAIAGK